MNTNFRNQMSELMRKSWQLVKVYGFTLSEAMRHMWQINKLKKMMAKGVVKFLYTKVDGSTRMAWGTLSDELIPQEALSGSGRKPNDSVTTYWDQEKGAFRCFKTANFLKIA